MIERENDTITLAELAESLRRFQWVHPEQTTDAFYADIVKHREPEYVIGDLYADSNGTVYIRRSNPEWTWLRRIGDGSTWIPVLDSYPKRPLRKLVPEE